MLNIERRDEVAVVHLPTDVDAANADVVADEVMAGVDNAVVGVVLDLSATRYLDSAGVDMVFRLHERLRHRRQRLHLAVDEESPLMRLITMVALAEVVPVHGDVETAVRAAQNGRGQTVPTA